MTSMTAPAPVLGQQPLSGLTAEEITARLHNSSDEFLAHLARLEVDDLLDLQLFAGSGSERLVQALNRPTLSRALSAGVCANSSAVSDPDEPDPFYQEDDEDPAQWQLRQGRTVQRLCSACPVRSACIELALRDRDTHAVRGLTQTQMRTRRRAESKRLAEVRAADKAVVQEEQVFHAAYLKALRSTADSAAYAALRQERRIQAGWSA